MIADLVTQVRGMIAHFRTSIRMIWSDVKLALPRNISRNPSPNSIVDCACLTKETAGQLRAESQRGG
jgi:hypothetical protein